MLKASIVVLVISAFIAPVAAQSAAPEQSLVSESRVVELSKQTILLAQDGQQSELLTLINRARSDRGLSPLRFSSSLTRAAQVHVRDIVANNYRLTHTGSDGSSVGDRVMREGYSYRAVAENVASGSRTPEGTFRQWMNSEGHRANMLNQNYTEVGIGYYLNAPRTADNHYWVLVVARPSRL